MARRRKNSSGEPVVWIAILAVCAWLINTLTIYGFLALIASGVFVYVFMKRRSNKLYTPNDPIAPAKNNKAAGTKSNNKKKFVDMPINKEKATQPSGSFLSMEQAYERITAQAQDDVALTKSTIDLPNQQDKVPPPESTITVKSVPLGQMEIHDAPSNNVDLSISHATPTLENLRPRSSVPQSHISDDELESFIVETPDPPKTEHYTIPTNPLTKQHKPAVNADFPIGIKWYAKGESVTIGQFTIHDGLILYGVPEPSEDIDYDIAGLINPKLPIAKDGDYTERTFGYWPRYSQTSPEARAAYLKWLANGKSDPSADIGYVFLYLYGIEKHFFDILPDHLPCDFDVHTLREECERLHRIYSPLNKSFRGYMINLLQLITLLSSSTPLQLHNDLGMIEGSDGSRLFSRMLVGQQIKAGKPIDLELVKVLITKDPIFETGDVLKKLPDIFWHIFGIEFKSSFPNGLYIENNQSQLQASYHPASPPWSSQRTITIVMKDLPDIFSFAKPQHEIQKVITLALGVIEQHKKQLRITSQRNIDQTLFSLPSKYWSSTLRGKVDSIAAGLKNFTLIMKTSDFAGALDLSSSISKHALSGVAKDLEDRHRIGIIPHPDIYLVLPALSDIHVLYRIEDDHGPFIKDEQYDARLQSALVCIELGSIVAHADQDFSAEEFSYFYKHIDSWSHLKPSDRSYLKGKTRYLHAKKINLTSVKKRIQRLQAEDIQTICSFISKLTHADGNVSPEEIKFLEKIYPLLGVKASQVSTDIQSNSSAVASPIDALIDSDSDSPSGSQNQDASSQPKNATPQKPSLVLNMERIASLHKENQQVSALLGTIFAEEEDVADLMTQTTSPMTEINTASKMDGKSTLLGLDHSHSTFLHALLQRPLWSRSEIEQIASQCNLMTDGALDCINEASFEQFDMPLIEGDDPIEMRLDLMENYQQ